MGCKSGPRFLFGTSEGNEVNELPDASCTLESFKWNFLTAFGNLADPRPPFVPLDACSTPERSVPLNCFPFVLIPEVSMALQQLSILTAKLRWVSASKCSAIDIHWSPVRSLHPDFAFEPDFMS